jgi:UDP:flavonoid glycosyltransferase YjiC (YdhE family)
MKVLMVCRGSQGDVYPHLVLAKRLTERGHEVMLNVPFQFEDVAKASGVPYTVEDDDVKSVSGGEKIELKNLFAWLGRSIQQQFDDLIPLLAHYDILIAENSEFAAPHIAEYTGKKLIRTCFGPMLPGKHIMPPLTSLMHSFLFFTPSNTWKLINMGINAISVKILNRNRARLGMKPFKDQGVYAPRHAFNLLLCSPLLSDTDEEWAYQWDISGYCFNDMLPYNNELYEQFLIFLQKDERPALFFTVGSINVARQQIIGEWLLAICQKHNHRLVIGSNWRKTSEALTNDNDLFILDGIIPHYLVMPQCAASIHHGGSGTTHSAARAGKPQMVLPSFADQPYWGYRTKVLGLGPGAVNSRKTTLPKLEKFVVDLLTNPVYKKNAAELGEKIRAENSLDKAADIIERVFGAKKE